MLITSATTLAECIEWIANWAYLSLTKIALSLEIKFPHLTEMPSRKRISLLMPDTEFGQFSQVRQLNL